MEDIKKAKPVEPKVNQAKAFPVDNFRKLGGMAQILQETNRDGTDLEK